ncbi:GAF domain-containing sensor histidine kinase [Actinomyces howellii]|nr:GAF domain-containing protein [Actinomyces howellii]
MTDSSTYPSDPGRVLLPGVPDDDLILHLPTGPGPDASGTGTIAYAVHADRLTSTRSRPAPEAPEPGAGGVDLFREALRLTSSLRVPDALRRLADSACTVTGARWATIAVLGRADRAPLTSGTATASPDELDAMITGADAASRGEGGVVICNDLSSAPFTGAIEGEGPGSVLSAPLRVHGYVYGRLYLCDKAEGFDPADAATVVALAEAAAVAVENSRLYRQARDREQWMALAQELTTLLLSGAEQDDALTHIAHRVREVAHADTAALILPSVGDTWICEIADGAHAGELIGTFFPPEGRALTALAHRTGLIEQSLAQAWEASDLLVEELAHFGPALYAPMVHRGRGVGVMLLLREQGAAPFTRQELEVAELFAGQATMAFELADAQHAEEMATLLDERTRIGRDLHDLAIQQLFATGMQITAARDRIRLAAEAGAVDAQDACSALEDSLAAVDDSVRQIRSIVRSLRDRDEDVGLVERLRREASLARTSLGYAPSLLLSVDGHGLAQAEPRDADELVDAVDAAVDTDIADDAVAVVREALSNVARHARASSVRVEVRFTGVLAAGVLGAGPRPGRGPAAIEVVCTDDGVGLDPAVTRRSGTANISERARRRAGSFVIGPGPGGGTRLVWWVPLEHPGEAVGSWQVPLRR